jgi:hypothetical protein
MRYLVLCVLAGLSAWPERVAAETGEEAPTTAALALDAKYHLPPQLILRVSDCHFIDVDPLGGSATIAAPTAEESQPTKRLSKRARIAIGVTVPIVVVGVGVGAGLRVAVSKAWSSSSSQ